MSDIKFPIKRNELYGTYVYLLNRRLDILKEKIAIYHSEQDLLSSRDYRDVYYETPRYRVISALDNRHSYFPVQEESRRELSIVIAKPLMLENLLYYAEYDKYLSREDLIDIRRKIFDGKFGYEHAELFGYEKKPKEIIKNGDLVPNPYINHSTDYSVNNYKLAKDPLIPPNIFEFLSKVDFNDPNAIFEPFSEEVNVKERILK